MVGLQSPGRETLGNLRVELGKGKACKRDEPQLGGYYNAIGYNAIGSKAPWKNSLTSALNCISHMWLILAGIITLDVHQHQNYAIGLQ